MEENKYGIKRIDSRSVIDFNNLIYININNNFTVTGRVINYRTFGIEIRKIKRYKL